MSRWRIYFVSVSKYSSLSQALVSCWPVEWRVIISACIAECSVCQEGSSKCLTCKDGWHVDEQTGKCQGIYHLQHIKLFFYTKLLVFKNQYLIDYLMGFFIPSEPVYLKSIQDHFLNFSSAQTDR